MCRLLCIFLLLLRVVFLSPMYLNAAFSLCLSGTVNSRHDEIRQPNAPAPSRTAASTATPAAAASQLSKVRLVVRENFDSHARFRSVASNMAFSRKIIPSRACVPNNHHAKFSTTNECLVYLHVV